MGLPGNSDSCLYAGKTAGLSPAPGGEGWTPVGVLPLQEQQPVLAVLLGPWGGVDVPCIGHAKRRPSQMSPTSRSHPMIHG